MNRRSIFRGFLGLLMAPFAAKVVKALPAPVVRPSEVSSIIWGAASPKLQRMLSVPRVSELPEVEIRTRNEYVFSRVDEVKSLMQLTHKKIPYKIWKEEFHQRITGLFAEAEWRKQYNDILRSVFLGESDSGAYPEADEEHRWRVIIRAGGAWGMIETDNACLNPLGSAFMSARLMNDVLCSGAPRRERETRMDNEVPNLCIHGSLMPKTTGGSGPEWPEFLIPEPSQNPL